MLREKLGGDKLSQYTFVDFCAGAGGPSVGIEGIINGKSKESENSGSRGRRRGEKGSRNGRNGRNGDGIDDEDEDEDQDVDGSEDDGDGNDQDRHGDEEDRNEDEQEGKEGKDEAVDFVLTDLHPHLTAWRAAAAQSRNILYVPTPVDAATAPSDLISRAVGHRRGGGQGRQSTKNPRSQSQSQPPNSSNPHPTHQSKTTPTSTHPPKKQFSLFFLALHHFSDPSASTILTHALRTSSGFGIFELQSRTFESLALMALFGPLMWLGSWWWFWGDWDLLWWMYMLPVVPFVVVFDGVVSSLRTRREGEVKALLGLGKRGMGGKGREEKEKGGSEGNGAEGGDAGGEIRKRKRQAIITTINEVEIEHENDDENDIDEDPIDFTKWHFSSGTETHTWPLGELNWFVAVKKE